jgi:isocitrate lyase
LEILKIIGVKEEKHPNVPFPYKLLPTFNYHASKSNEEKIQSFILNIVEMGFN